MSEPVKIHKLSEYDKWKIERNIAKSAEPDGCWLWKGYIKRDGYGRIQLQGIFYRAHRLTYTMYVGDIPEGMFILHSCRNRHCVAPHHLRPGTVQENSVDMAKDGTHYNRVLTEEQVYEIRDLCASKTMTQSEIGAKYGVGSDAVSSIHLRQTWKHLPEQTKEAV